MKVTKETGHVVNQQFEIMNSSGYVNHRSDYVNQLTERLFALQQKQLLCDMSLTADDGKLLVHSCVLAAASDFIANQFEQLAQLQIDMTHMPRLGKKQFISSFSIFPILLLVKIYNFVISFIPKALFSCK